jgi:hypothetical protein
MKTHNLGIDCDTRGKKALIRRLARLKSVEYVEDGSEYQMDHNYSQVRVTTTMCEDALEDWLYKYSPIDYVGVFQLDR